MLAFTLAAGLTLDSQQAVAAREALGALPAVWRLEEDLRNLEEFLETPSKMEVLLQVNGPDCACVGKEQGPDCACVGKEEKHSLAQKGPDCACVGKEQGPDCACVGKEEKAPVLGILQTVYDRFQKNLADADKLEEESKKLYDGRVDAAKKGKEMAQYWETERATAHHEYEIMKQVASTGIDRIGAVLKEKPTDFKAVKPALLSFCKDSLAKLAEAKAPHKKAAPVAFLQLKQDPAPEDALAKEMTHDLEMNFNKIAPFGKEDTAKELQDHAAKTQDTLVDAVENAEVAEIKRAVFRALTRLRAATIKEFDTIARLETQAIDAYNDAHHYRAENPLSHLHEDEAPVETDKLKSFH